MFYFGVVRFHRLRCLYCMYLFKEEREFPRSSEIPNLGLVSMALAHVFWFVFDGPVMLF